jgi:hypothetical protein
VQLDPELGRVPQKPGDVHCAARAGNEEKSLFPVLSYFLKKRNCQNFSQNGHWDNKNVWRK